MHFSLLGGLWKQYPKPMLGAIPTPFYHQTSPERGYNVLSMLLKMDGSKSQK
jgi:hypothetical protein